MILAVKDHGGVINLVNFLVVKNHKCYNKFIFKNEKFPDNIEIKMNPANELYVLAKEIQRSVKLTAEIWVVSKKFENQKDVGACQDCLLTVNTDYNTNTSISSSRVFMYLEVDYMVRTSKADWRINPGRQQSQHPYCWWSRQEVHRICWKVYRKKWLKSLHSKLLPRRW